MSETINIQAGYAELLRSLKERIRSSRVKAALSVNRELIILYWHIGRDILKRQATEQWGSKVIDRLSTDLKREFTEMRGFSTRNLKYMRAFAEAYSNKQFVQQVVAQIPWGHNLRIINYRGPTSAVPAPAPFLVIASDQRERGNLSLITHHSSRITSHGL